MQLSIIIPAFNEEKELPACLESVHKAVAACHAEAETEIIVADNNSTDRTAGIAREAGATVVFEPFNQIGRARNAGAAAATGEMLLFIDADSRLSPGNLRRVLDLIHDDSCAGGGCTVSLPGSPFLAGTAILLWNAVSVIMKYAAGSFIFCRRRAFQETGGFSPDLFAAEELDLSKKLQQWAATHESHFIILRGAPHISSSRKFRLYTTRELFQHLTSAIFRFGRTMRSRSALDFFYDGRR